MLIRLDNGQELDIQEVYLFKRDAEGRETFKDSPDPALLEKIRRDAEVILDSVI